MNRDEWAIFLRVRRLSRMGPHCTIAAAVILAGLLALPAGAQDRSASGISVPAQNAPNAGDPTKNVLDLVLAAIKRLDDLSEAAAKRADDLRAAIEKISQVEVRRIDEIMALNAKHEAKLSDVVREFTTKMSEAESKRIDALRASDAAATKEASTLALSSIKDITAQAFTASKDATAKQESAADKRFDQLKSELGVQFKSLDEKVVLLTNQNSVSSGRDAGSSAMWGVAGGIMGLLIGAATLAFSLLRRPTPGPHPPATDPALLAALVEMQKRNGERHGEKNGV